MNSTKKRDNRITVITTVYNDEKNIIEFYNNLFKQSLQPFEYILVDGGSSDKTVANVQEYLLNNNSMIRLYYGHRLNVAEGFNKAISESKTSIIIVTAVGNTYDEHFFEELVKEYDKNHKNIIYGKVIGQEQGFFSKIYNDAFLFGNKGRMVFSNRGALIEKEVYDKIGVYKKGFIYAGEDTEFEKRALREGVSFGSTKDAILFWKTPESFSAFVKQRRVYFIGNLQHSGITKKMKHSILAFVISLVYLFTFAYYHNLLMTIPIVLFFLYEAYKIRSKNLLSVNLRIIDKFLDVIYIIFYYKYSRGAYRIR